VQSLPLTTTTTTPTTPTPPSQVAAIKKSAQTRFPLEIPEFRSRRAALKEKKKKERNKSKYKSAIQIIQKFLQVQKASF